MAKRTAVIDIGSNSVRLAIYERTSRFAFHLLHEEKSRVRISEAAYENSGNLQDAPMERAIAALGNFISLCKAYQVRKILCVATSAVRDAKNRNQFVNRVKRELGLNIKVIDGLKEAHLGGVACANLLPSCEALTIDIGGGSTEFAQLQNGNVIRTHSLDMGTVRLKELFFDKGDIISATAYIDAALKELPFDESAVMIGIGGTFRALARSLLKQSEHPLQKLHGFEFDASELRTYGSEILAADEKTLSKLGIRKERYDVIKPGTLILLRVLERLKTLHLLTSGVGVREGVFLHDMLRNNKERFPENFNPSIRYLIDKYILNPRHSNNLAKVTKQLFELLHEPLKIDPVYRYELTVAAKIAKIGASLHFYSYHQHSYYLAQTALEYGFTHQQIMLISTLVRFQKRKRPARSYKDRYAALLPDADMLSNMSFILSLADTLLTHQPLDADLNMRFEADTLYVSAAKPAELYLASEQLKALKLPSKISVVIA